MGNTVKRMKKVKSGALAVHVEAGLLSTMTTAFFHCVHNPASSSSPSSGTSSGDGVAPNKIAGSAAALTLTADAGVARRHRTVASTITKQYTCSITQGLVVGLGPLIAEVGSSYGRSAIEEWLASQDTSPLNPGCILDPSRLISSAD